MTSLLSLPTPRLTLRLQTPPEVLAFIDALSPADRAEVSPDWLARMKATSPSDPAAPWSLAFTILETATQTPVGTCAFKGPPNDSGAVEIAYGIHEPHRNRG